MAHTWGSRVPFTLLLLGALAQPAHAAPSAAPPGGFATDRIVVRLKAEAKSGRAADALSARAGERLERVRTTGDGREVLRLGRRVDAAQFAALARRLAADPAVADVLPDRVFFPSLLPDDPQYGSQWALFEAHGVGAPAAWDRTTGSAGVTVAIVDTGKLEHPDLAGRWLPGHDFVGDANRSSDGGGRDGDATDTGDWVTAAEAASGPLSGCPVTESRWHGLAMAGLIAATGNNALGVAGLDWNAKLLPVRAVGKCGGYESDIADGIRWAAGYPVPGVPANASPAKVVNVSLESAGTCSTLTQGAVDDALAVGATVVASAGNNGASVANFSPANCDGVIAVGATNRLGRLPSYANTGAAIALSAPGGEGSGADALLTTFDTGTTAPALSGTWAAVNGTSASAALVSGIVSLLYARNPALVAQQVRHLLLATAKPFPSDAVGGQVNCNTANCGVGIADALATRYATAPGPGGPIAQAVAPATAAVAAMALRSDGRVFTIGRSPVERAEVTGARRLAMSAGQALALKADGTVVDITGAVTPVAGIERIVAIDAGARQVNEPWALALRADGTLFAWGNNGYGKLADGTETSRTTVAAVPLPGVSAMAAGATHALAIVDGEVWAWGSNEVGELGIGAVSPDTCATAAGGSAPCAKAPLKVPGLAGVVFVAAGSRTSFAVLADGTVRAWGNNGSGQLGDGTTTNRDAPVVVAGLSGVKAVSAGDDHAFAITQGGDLYAWGGNGFAQLLTGGAGAAVATPFLVTTVGKVAAARAGAAVSLVTGVDGRLHSAGLYAPGYNVDYGPGSFTPQPGAVFVIDLFPAAFVAEAEVTAFGAPFTSNAVTAAAIPTGSVVTIAGGEYAIDGGAWTAAPGTIGPGQSVRVRALAGACGTAVTATLTIAGVAREYRIASAACDTTPDALGWLSAQAQVAPGAPVASNAITVNGINTPVAVSVSSALPAEYSVGCTGVFTSAPGTIANGQAVCVRITAPAQEDAVGEATLTVGPQARVFRVITAKPAFFAQAAPGGYTMLRSDGRVFGFDTNYFRFEPRGDIGGVKRIAVAPAQQLALREDGSVWELSSQTAPVAGLSNITDIATGSLGAYQPFALALRGDGAVFAWGENSNGQLGDGTQVSRATVAQVPLPGAATAIAAGNKHALAVVGGKVYAWGVNESGQLGIGPTSPSTCPVPAFSQNNPCARSPLEVPGLTGVVAVAAGNRSSFAILADGTVRSWGHNDAGQLGDGTTTNRDSPVTVAGLAGITRISAADRQALAMTATGSLFAWGSNEWGMLLTGSAGPNQPSPVAVMTIGPVTAIYAGEVFSEALAADGRVFFAGSYITTTLSAPTVFFAPDLFPPAFVAEPAATAFGATYESNAITALGIPAGSAISVAGGEYAVDGGAWTAAPGTIGPGQTVRVRLQAGACGATATATLTIAGVAREFRVVSVACDAVPDPIAPLVAKAPVAPGATVVSNTVTVAGINTPVAVSVAGGEFSADCATNWQVAGSVGATNALCVRLVAPAGEDAVGEATLTVGPHARTFRVITASPGFVAQPTPGAYSMLRSDGRVFGFSTGSLQYVMRGDIANVARMAVSASMHLGLRADGTVWDFSGNAEPVAGLADITAIATGSFNVQPFGLALRADGVLFAWGSNAYGKLGDGTETNRWTPAAVPGLGVVTAMAAGQTHALAVVGGEVWGWGENDAGQLGIGAVSPHVCEIPGAGGATHPCAKSPVKVPGLANVVAVAAGFRTSFAILADGSVRAWGNDRFGQLGTGGTATGSCSFPNASAGRCANTPQVVPGLTGIARISAGDRHVLAMKADGTLYAWGYNGFGGLMTGVAGPDQLTPVAVTTLGAVVAIDAAADFSNVLRADGRVFFAGYYAASGPGVSLPSPVPVFWLDLFPPAFVTEVGVTAFGAPFESNAITTAGIPAGSAISVAGGEYAIDGGAWTAAPGTIGPGQSVRVRAQSGACGAAVTATLTIAGVPREYRIESAACDATPDPIGPLVAQAPVAPGAAVISNAVTVSGINTPVAVSVSSALPAEYSVGCNGSFTSAPGTIANGQAVCVRLTAPAGEDAVGEATLAVGPHARTFRVITTKAGFTAAPAAGGYTLLRSDGRVFGFSTGSLQYVMRGDIANLARMAVSASMHLGLRADGTVWDFSGYAEPVAGLADITAIATGSFNVQPFGLALRADGVLFAWGSNAYGKLGDGTEAHRWTPAAVPGLGVVTAIAAGQTHALAVVGGEVWAWGENDAGQLGIGAVSPHVCEIPGSGGGTHPCAKSPVKVPGLANVVAVAAGFRTSFAILADGSVRAWGNDRFGQLGTGGTATGSCSFPNVLGAGRCANTPQVVPGLTGIARISAGDRHVLAMKADGTLYAWGFNGFGGLLTGAAGPDQLSPVAVTGLGPVIAIDASSDFSNVVVADGRVFFAGYYGASGPGVSLPSPTVVFALLAGDLTPDPFAFNAVFGAPRATEIFSNAITVGGLGAASPITVTGGAYSVNGGDFTSAPGFVVNGDTVRARVLSSAAYETVASATVAIGGAVGASATFFAYTRRDPALPATIPAVALGEAHSAYLNSQGLVFAFGRNANGQLGNGSTISSSRPTAVPGVAGVTALAAGANHALVARSDGTVFAWGFNASGQLGDGTTQSRTSAVAPAGPGFVKAVAAGRHHSLALTPGGAVFAWGLNDDGQVGDGTAAATRTTPVAVAGLASGVKAIAAGGRHSLALRDDGTVLAWGANEAGQVGDGTTAQRRSPTLVSGLAGVVAIAAGDSHSLALKADGTLWAWGANGFGQLGLGDNANRPVPTAVAALGGGVGLVAAGEFHTLAVKAGGALFVWGRNANSQLGDGANADRNLPVAVAAPAGVVAIAAGGRHSAALDAERRLFVFGDNFFGQVGNRSGNYNPQSGALDTLRGDAVISSGTGGTGTGVGTGGSSGSSVIAIDGQAAAFDFGSRVAGGTSTVSGTLRNASIDTPITGISIEVTGAAYAKLADDCTAAGVLPPDQQCGFTLAFTPAGPGPFEGEVLVNSSVVGSPERRALFGTGTAPASPAIAFAKAGVDFAPRFVGTAGTAALQLFNTGNAPLSVSAVTSSAGDFSATHACASVAPGAACEITVTFQPAAVGARAALLTLASNADGGPHLVTVSGTGVAPQPASYTLSVARYGSGSGTVSSSPAGIDCGATCQASYLQATMVTLTATPEAGSRFTGWTGACTGAGPCVVAMNAAASVTAVFAREVRRGDVNADGRADLFWRESGGGAGLSWWTMNGPGLTGYGYFEVPAEWQVADVGDLDGDGRMDLVWQRAADGATYLWRLDGLAPVGFHDLGILPPAEWGLVGAADLDGDGRADLVWRHKATGMVYGWLMNGAAIVAQGVVAQVGLDWAIADLADFDGDGRADILWRRVADGATAVWFLDGLAPTGGGTIATVDPAQWLLVGAADFSGDGKADLLWRSVAGDVVVWVLDGGAFAASGYLGNPGIAWSVRALGDLDGDGRADIVWRHADGTMYLWRMNGTAAIAFEPMANPGGSWEIVAP